MKSLIFCLMLIHNHPCWGPTSTTTVSIQTTVLPILELFLPQVSETLTVQPSPAGFNPSSVTLETFYSISTNTRTQLSGSLNSSLPAGASISVQAQAPNSGYSTNWVQLDGSPIVLVANIEKSCKKYIPLKIQLSSPIETDSGTGLITIRYILDS
jgi:hypothetical protein